MCLNIGNVAVVLVGKEQTCCKIKEINFKNYFPRVNPVTVISGMWIRSGQELANGQEQVKQQH